MHALHPEYHRWKLFPFSFQHVSEDLLPYGTQNCNTSFTYVRNMRIKNNDFRIASRLTKYPYIWSLYYFSISQQGIDVCCVLYYSMNIFCCRKENKYSNIWLLGFLRFSMYRNIHWWCKNCWATILFKSLLLCLNISMIHRSTQLMFV